MHKHYYTESNGMNNLSQREWAEEEEINLHSNKSSSILE